MVYKKRTKKEQKEIAKERINLLFEKADKNFNKNKSLANRYVTLARKISMKTNTKIPSELKRKFCKKCHKYIKPGINARIRIDKGKIIVTCLECKNIFRQPYLKEKKAKHSCP